LEGTKITDVSALSGLINLTELTLSNNQINDITVLSGLDNLRYLCFSGNPLSGDPDSLSDKNVFEDISVVEGDVLEFGGINWEVLEVIDSHALIITENLLMMGLGAYGYTRSATWETSFIRDYLNNEFYHRFTPSERLRMRETLVVNERNPWYRSTRGGENTMDRVFLLDINEAVHYFGDSGQLENRPDGTMYIYDEFNSVRRTAFDDGSFWFYWLRTTGSTNDLAAGVDGAGNINIFGTGINNQGGVRPVVWINLEGQ